MPRYRPDIENFVTPPDYRIFFPYEHPATMAHAIRHTFEAVRPQLERRFEEIKAFYRTAQEAKERYDAFMEKVAENNLSWEGLDAAIYVEASERMRYAEHECEATAEYILFTLDAIVTTLVNELTKKDKCVDAGAVIADPYTVDRILDAIGNYMRHRYEWKRLFIDGAKLTQLQRDSIFPLASLLEGAPVSDDHRASEIVLAHRSPARAVLDVLSHYESDGENATYGTVHDRMIELSERIIEQYFNEWFEARMEKRSKAAESQNAAGASVSAPREKHKA